MAAELTDTQIDDAVYACRQAGADSTYDIVRACLALATTAPAQGAEPEIYFGLRFPSDHRVCLSTVFDTAKEAEDYGEQCGPGTVVVPLYTSPQPTAEVEKDATWMSCESRRPWVVNGLRTRAEDLRTREKRAKAAFRKDFMGETSRYYADACGEAAAVFERRLAALQSDQAQAGKGGWP